MDFISNKSSIAFENSQDCDEQGRKWPEKVKVFGVDNDLDCVKILKRDGSDPVLRQCVESHSEFNKGTVLSE